MLSASKPRWQQVTALVSLSAGGAITGFSFVPRAAADLASPTGMPIRLLALKQSAKPEAADDAVLRSAIVNVAHYYLRMAKGETPAEMQALTWQNDSINGADHGASCAAFASLTLELAAQVVGQHSWVTGGSTYPWPLHRWADVRVDPNPASLGVISIRQDAEAHHRWNPLGDGYQPLPGDWVLFPGHVQVVTQYADGVLHTIGGDSLPNFSVNAHEYRDPLGAQGAVGFVNNGNLRGAPARTPHGQQHRPAAHQARDQATRGQATIPGAPAARDPKPARERSRGSAAIPAASVPDPGHSVRQPAPRRPGPGQQHTAHGGQERSRVGTAGAANAEVPGARTPGHRPRTRAAGPGAAAIPGLSVQEHHWSAGSKGAQATHYRRHHPSRATAPLQGASVQQAFISQVAPGAIAAQHRYGVPAAVTIAQAIDESAWGQSSLATKDHNLFGIKGTGPAGSDTLPTQEYGNGQSVTRTASFRIYNNVAESINDHGSLLATSGYYARAMADHQDPNAFAAALTGVYATDPAYGTKLIDLMRRYDLYRYDVITAAATTRAETAGRTTVTGHPHAARTPRVKPSWRAPSPGASSPAPSPGAPSPGASSPGPSSPSPGPSSPSPTPSPGASSPAASPNAARGPGKRTGPRRPASAAKPSTQTAPPGDWLRRSILIWARQHHAALAEVRASIITTFPRPS
jgi:flagellum-specific peptidoglycan hydrolase FlgJ